MMLCMKCNRKIGIAYNELCYHCYKMIGRVALGRRRANIIEHFAHTPQLEDKLMALEA